ncbi:heavy metal-associated isoprenylated plant protein 46-like [Rhododendron vialii]|uniref:heavy metal-associated isoprenylated plant protein 46-like n=1 Tax=Rhododendron vialii TaxID=182163 RepID=UPI00265E291A|nr:heavy metal-associated isoprenylated plant protein 46-like [Rhododendron vialii]
MQQKVVIKLPLNAKKSSCKAMQIAVGVPGVASAAWAGEDKNQIEVTGDGIDAVALTMLLRKNVGFAELVSVAPVSEDNKSNEVVAVQIPWYYNYPYGYGSGHMYVIRDQNPASCSIL